MNNYLLFLIKEELEGTKAIKSYCFTEHTEQLCYSQPQDAAEAKSVN